GECLFVNEDRSLETMECDPTNGVTKWMVYANSTVVHSATGLCIEASVDDGAKAADCNGNPNQKIATLEA
ncbi:hypothetical protein As57867_007708, partial [Aphanomyces stellatus]